MYCMTNDTKNRGHRMHGGKWDSFRFVHGMLDKILTSKCIRTSVVNCEG